MSLFWKTKPEGFFTGKRNTNLHDLFISCSKHENCIYDKCKSCFRVPNDFRQGYFRLYFKKYTRKFYFFCNIHILLPTHLYVCVFTKAQHLKNWSSSATTWIQLHITTFPECRTNCTLYFSDNSTHI